MCVIYTKQPKVVGPALLVPFLQAVIKLTRYVQTLQRTCNQRTKKEKMQIHLKCCTVNVTGVW